jgi:hypothetical protein
MRSRDDFRVYQNEAESFILDKPRTYLAAKAGAGKTAIALAVIEELMFNRFDVRKTLVIAPKRVAKQWPTEAQGWTFGAGLRFGVYVGTRDERKAALEGSYDVLACSFEFFPELVQQFKLASWPFGLVIFDEASRLRKGGRRGSVGWKAMNAISSKTLARIVLMSGSPRPGTAHELFAPVFLLDQGKRLGTTLTGFRADYLEPNKQNRSTGQVYSWKLRSGMEPKLYGEIGDLYFAVDPDLGLKSVVIDRYVMLPPAIEKACMDLQNTQVLDFDDLELTAASQGTVAGKLHQMCQGAVFGDNGKVSELHSEKLDELQEIVEEIDAPVIIAYWYTHDLQRIKKLYPQAVDVSTEEGMAAAKRGEVEIALLHPGSAGHGIDGLQKHFSNLVWFVVPASFELYDQTNKRIVRSGQVGETASIYRIIAANGIADERLLAGLYRKEREQDEFFDYVEKRTA